MEHYLGLLTLMRWHGVCVMWLLAVAMSAHYGDGCDYYGYDDDYDEHWSAELEQCLE